MSHRPSRTPLRCLSTAAALSLPVALLAAPAAVGLPSQTVSAVAPAKAPAAPLLGTWVGTYEGYYAGRYESGQQRIVVSKAKGYVAKGTWQFREDANERWSSPEPVQFSVLPETDESDLDVYGSDTAGTYAGELRGDRLELTYSEAAAEPQTLVFRLRRK